MKLPRSIYDALSTKQGFDKLYIKNHIKLKNHAKAFDKTVEDIREFIPGYEPNFGDEWYRVSFWAEEKEVEVPDECAKIFTDIYGLFDMFYVRHQLQNKAYYAMMEWINRYFPHYKPFKNYEAWRKHLALRHKNHIKSIKTKK